MPAFFLCSKYVVVERKRASREQITEDTRQIGDNLGLNDSENSERNGVMNVGGRISYLHEVEYYSPMMRVKKFVRRKTKLYINYIVSFISFFYKLFSHLLAHVKLVLMVHKVSVLPDEQVLEICCTAM